MQQWYDQNKGKYTDLVNTLERLVRTLLEEAGIPYHSVNGRVKGRDSCSEKFERKNYTSPEQMMDLAGLRIITHTTEEVGRVCRMIEREFTVDEENSGDKALDMSVDRVGYLSVHYVVKMSPDRVRLREYAKLEGLLCEIQVRSLLQHAWAEIEHDRGYKFSGVLPKEIERKFYLVAGTLELMDQEFCALSREIDRYAAHVKEKTVQGDVKDIEIDSTSLLQFLNEFFKEYGPEELSGGFQLYDSKIIKELSACGIKTLQQLRELLAQRTAKEWTSGYGSTYFGILRDAMILKSPKTYFQSAWKGSWGILPPDLEDWRRLGVDMRELESCVDLSGIMQSYEMDDDNLDLDKP